MSFRVSSPGSCRDRVGVESVFSVHAPGCGGYQHGMWTAPATCGRPVVAAGPVFYPYPHPQTWLGFACAEHVGQLEVARRSSTPTGPYWPAAAPATTNTAPTPAQCPRRCRWPPAGRPES